jgi:hypothetical protein
MEQLEQKHAKMLCHNCHRFAVDEDGSCVEFIEPENCPRCLCPESQIDIRLLMNPLYRCDCGNLIMQYSPKMYSCLDCRYGYSDYILKVVDIANQLHIRYSQVVDLDPLISEGLLECDGRNHAFSFIDRSVIGDYLKRFMQNDE